MGLVPLGLSEYDSMTRKELCAEIDKLRGEVRVLTGSHEWITREKVRLETAIKRTLDENGHLADGDDCTLIHLKRSMPTTE